MLTFDHFHVVTLMSERLDDSAANWCVCRGRDEASHQRTALALAASHGQSRTRRRVTPRAQHGTQLPLQTASRLKAELGLLREQADGRQGWAYLRDWWAKTVAKGVQLHAMTDTLGRYAKGPHLLQDWPDKRENGSHQPKNPRTAHRPLFRDDEFFKLRLYALHEAELKLVGT